MLLVKSDTEQNFSNKKGARFWSWFREYSFYSSSNNQLSISISQQPPRVIRIHDRACTCSTLHAMRGIRPPPLIKQNTGTISPSGTTRTTNTNTTARHERHDIGNLSATRRARAGAVYQLALCAAALLRGEREARRQPHSSPVPGHLATPESPGPPPSCAPPRQPHGDRRVCCPKRASGQDVAVSGLPHGWLLSMAGEGRRFGRAPGAGPAAAVSSARTARGYEASDQPTG